MRKRNKALGFIITSQFIHKLGETLYDLIIPILVLKITGSAWLMGLVYIIGEMSELAVYFFGGVLVDFFHRKKLLITIAILQAFSISLIPILHTFDLLFLPILLVIVFIIDLCVALYRIADVAIIPMIVKKEDLPVANGLMQSTVSISSAVGPAISGIIIASFGIFSSIWVNTFTFLILLLTFSLLNVNKTQSLEKLYIKDLFRSSIDGLKFTLKDKTLKTILIWQSLFVFGIHGSILMMIFHLQEVLNYTSQHVGLIISLGAIGGVISGIAFPLIQKYVKSGILLLISGSIVSLSFIFIAFLTNWIMIGIFYALIFIGIGTVSRLTTIYIQSNTDEKYLGRVISSSSLFISILTPISIVLASWIAESINTSTLFLFSALILLVTVIFTFVSKLVKEDWNIVKEAS